MIQPTALKTARKRKGLTQEQLAEAVKCTKDTVSRWERGTVQAVRRSYREALCKALGTTWSKLTAPAPEETESDRLFGRVAVSASIRAHGRAALQLVAMRYGVPPHEILELAPLLFLVLAERSLLHRRQRLKDIDSAFDELDERVTANLAHLGPQVLARSISADDCLVEESKSIDNRDVFGHSIDWTEQDEGPFMYFMRELVAELPKGLVSMVSYDGATIDSYRLAEGTLRQALGLADGTDARVLNHIWYGGLDLAECLRQKGALGEDEYVQWLDDECDRAVAESDRHLRELFPEEPLADLPNEDTGKENAA